MAVDVPRRENNYTQQQEWKVTKHDVTQNSAICARSSQGQLLSHYYWHVTKDGSKLFTQNRWSLQFVHYNSSRCEQFEHAGFVEHSTSAKCNVHYRSFAMWCVAMRQCNATQQLAFTFCKDLCHRDWELMLLYTAKRASQPDKLS